MHLHYYTLITDHIDVLIYVYTALVLYLVRIFLLSPNRECSRIGVLSIGTTHVRSNVYTRCSLVFIKQ